MGVGSLRSERGYVPILETTFGSHITAEEKIHGVARLLKIVGPFEIESHRFRAFSLRQCFSRNRQMELVALHAKLYLFDLFPSPAAIVFLEPGSVIGLDDMVDNEIESLPSSGGILIRVDEQPHPVAPRAGADRGGGADIEEKVRRIARYFGRQDVVAPGSVAEMQPCHAIEITRRRFPGVIPEFRRDALPLVEAFLEANCSGRRGGRQRRRAFESAHVRHQLPVIVVPVSALHGLDIPAELLVELVHEDQRTSRLAPAPGDPLIPAGDHDEGRLQLKGPLPLFLEVVSVIHGAGRGFFTPIMEAAPAGVAGAHVGDFGVLLAQILSD